MRLGSYEVKLEKKVRVTGWEATTISLLAILIGLALVGLIFLKAGVNPLTGLSGHLLLCLRQRVRSAPDDQPIDLHPAVHLRLHHPDEGRAVEHRHGRPALRRRAGRLRRGAGLRRQGSQTPTLAPGIVIGLMMLGALLGGAVIGAIPGFLKGRFNTNEIVVTMMLNSIGFWLIAFMIKEGGPFMGGGGEGQGFKLSESVFAPMVLGGTFTIPIALGLAALLYFMFAKTTLGYQIKAFGLSPSAAKYAGISPQNVPLLVFILGGLIAGLAGYHYFAAVPGLYKIPTNYGDFGDLSFYGIICGLISQGNPLAAIPFALLFGGLTNGGRFVQGQLQLGYGIDYALLGVLMITLVAFQFFYRNTIVWKKIERES